MKELNFDAGVVRYNINGKAEIEFNPTDAVFAERLMGVFESLEGLQSKRSALDKADAKEVFKTFRELDAEMRNLIDGAFAEPVCDALFGEMNVFAYNADGVPVWAAFMLAIMGEVQSGVNTATNGDTAAKLQKYIDKYVK